MSRSTPPAAVRACAPHLTGRSRYLPSFARSAAAVEAVSKCKSAGVPPSRPSHRAATRGIGRRWCHRSKTCEQNRGLGSFLGAICRGRPGGSAPESGPRLHSSAPAAAPQPVSCLSLATPDSCIPPEHPSRPSASSAPPCPASGRGPGNRGNARQSSKRAVGVSSRIRRRAQRRLALDPVAAASLETTPSWSVLWAGGRLSTDRVSRPARQLFSNTKTACREGFSTFPGLLALEYGPSKGASPTSPRGDGRESSRGNVPSFLFPRPPPRCSESEGARQTGPLGL